MGIMRIARSTKVASRNYFEYDYNSVNDFSSFPSKTTKTLRVMAMSITVQCY